MSEFLVYDKETKKHSIILAKDKCHAQYLAPLLKGSSGKFRIFKPKSPMQLKRWEKYIKMESISNSISSRSK